MSLQQTKKSLITLAMISSAMIFSIASISAQAQNPAEKGLAIAIEADKRDIGFGDSSVSMEMILRNQYGEETKRSMRNKTLEQANDGDKALIIFDNPRDVKGTAFLSFTHKSKADDQWLYLPALKRVKRIASSNKSGPFMGSEFAFEDISSQEVEKYTYQYLKNEDLNGLDHFVIERDPVDPKSGYSKQIAWLDTQEYRVSKVDFYDRKGDMLKTLTVSDYQQYLGKYWRANTWEMINHQTGKATVLNFNEYVFNNQFKDRDFNKNSLARAK